MTTFGRFGAAVLGGLLAIPGFQAATAACNAGDMAGGWSMYASMYLNNSNSVPTIMRCNVNLTNADNNPIKYNMAGSCTNYQSSADVPINVTIKNGHLTENAASCKVTGNFQLGSGVIFPTVTLIEARVESSGNVKKNASGIARIFLGSDNYTLLHFNLVR